MKATRALSYGSPLARRFQGLNKPTVWHEFTPLAVQLNAINLGQGFPDFETPSFIKRNLEKATFNGLNQYCRSAGHLPLVNELAKRYSPLLDREVDPLNNVAVTVGASGALYSAMQAFIEPGDEVVTFAPFFDIYRPQVEIAGGKLVSVPLIPSDKCASDSNAAHSANERFSLDVEGLRRAITPRTKLLLLNTPHNPTGKLFSLQELQAIAALVQQHERLIVVTDEVYESMTYEDAPLTLAELQGGKDAGEGSQHGHLRMASLPGMWDRTLTISSAGKTFSCTGWKIGWTIGPEALTKPIQLANQYSQFSVSTPAQEAIAATLQEASNPYEGFADYYAWLKAEYLRKRRRLAEALLAGGITPIIPQGGFFIVGDTSNLHVPQQYLDAKSPAIDTMTRDWALCTWLAHEAKVVAIPPSAFYATEDASQAANYARFAFCKTDEALLQAKESLQRFYAKQ